METYIRMPTLAQSFCGFRHTLDSALALLCELKIPVERITITMDGKGYPDRWVVEQDPPPGTIVDGSSSIALRVAGLGYFHSLPVGMWDRGNEAEPGTEEIVALLDDPLEKARHWVREGARLFDVHPHNPDACARWIRLFGISPDSWPQTLWYPLALLLPHLSSIAGTEGGLRFALNLLLSLPLKAIRRSPSWGRIAEDDFSRLGRQNSRLGVECVIGDRKEELARLGLVIGPVSLATYYEFCAEEKRRLLDAILGLVAACYQKCSIAWEVEDSARAPRLGRAEQNSILGINSYLGTERIAQAA